MGGVEDLLNLNFDSFFSDLDKERSLNLPKVIAAKKKKFLKAIGANEQLEKMSDVNIEDENLPIGDFFKMLWEVDHWDFDDSIVISNFENIKKPEFDLKTYIACVKNLYSTNLKSECMCYLLCNARDFTKPQKNLFIFAERGENKIFPSISEVTTDPMDQQSPFTLKLMALMDDLLTEYNESKYQRVNLSVTYLVLLMARKFKSEWSFVDALNNPKTNQDYNRLCPRPLCENLPNDEPLYKNRIESSKQLMTLILYAYNKSARLTRRVLWYTCLANLEFTGLGLPKMFDQIVKRYCVSDSGLWEALCIKDRYEAMFALADFHYSQYEGEHQEPPKSYVLFPYCRLLNQSYHANLSCSVQVNHIVCYAMACLIDKKIGYDKSFVRKSKWIEKMSQHAQKMGEKLADEVDLKIKNDVFYVYICVSVKKSYFLSHNTILLTHNTNITQTDG